MESLHMCVVVAPFGAAIFGLALLGIPFVAGLGLGQSFLIAYAISFSSTVFAVKVVEERGEMMSLHGRIAIGILIVQDLAAVIFLAISTGKVAATVKFQGEAGAGSADHILERRIHRQSANASFISAKAGKDHTLGPVFSLPGT